MFWEVPMGECVKPAGARTVHGKTVTRVLTRDQWNDYQPWFENARRVRKLAAELESLTLQQFGADPRWRPK